MPEPLFDIVFRGDLVPGHQLPDVKARLAQLFKIDAAKTEPLFSGAAVALKRNLDEVTAGKYQAALRAAGAAVELRQVRQTASSAQRAQTTQKLSLAPPGADLLSQSERVTVEAPQLDLADYVLRPMDGYLLDEAERAPVASAPELDSYLDLAPLGAALVESRAEEAPGIVADFDLAEPGEDLLKPEERPKEEAVRVSTDHISLA